MVRCWIFCRARMRLRRTWRSGTGRRWRFQRRGRLTPRERRASGTSALGTCAEEGERVEVGVGVVGIGVLGALEEVYDEIGERRGENLVGDLEAVAGEDELRKCAGGVIAGKGEDDDDGGVYGLAGDGGADGAGPEPAATREQLESGHGVGVGEFAGPEGDEACGEQARKESEDGDEGLLVVEVGIGRQCDDECGDSVHESGAAEAEPDGAARGGVAVDLGKDVSEDVGDGEEDESAGDGEDDIVASEPGMSGDGPWPDVAEGAEANDLLGDEVGNEQDDDKGRNEDVEVAEPAGHRGQGYRRREKGAGNSTNYVRDFRRNLRFSFARVRFCC